LAPTFVADNSVLNGIFPKPNFQTHGEGPVTGQEVLFTITFTTPFTLDADHYFFVPQVGLNTVSSEFYWLSGQRPTTPPFSPDLQMWVRNETLAPDWLRVGTDIVGGSPAPTFNGAFSLNGETVPEPSSIVLLLSGVATLWNRRKHFAK
jgi:hypothetical protein